MRERVDKLRTVAGESVIAIVDKHLAELETLTDIATLSGKSSDIKMMMEKQSTVERAIKLIEDDISQTLLNSKQDVLKYLDNSGYKIASRTLDDHIKKGKLNRLADGSFTKVDVDNYAKANLKKQINEDLQEQIKTVQLDRARIQAEREQAKLAEEQGRLINRDKVGLEFASRINEMKRLFEEAEESLPVLLFGKDHTEIKEIIKDSHRNILDIYSRKLEVLK